MSKFTIEKKNNKDKHVVIKDFKDIENLDIDKLDKKKKTIKKKKTKKVSFPKSFAPYA